jgi:hypothetical protein
MKEEIQVTHGKLEWPAGTPRTLIGNREPNSQWKKTTDYYEEALIKELDRLGVVGIKITTNNTAQDPGVAVWISRQRPADYSWQQILGIDSPSPTREEVNTAYRTKSRPYHPDNPSNSDLEMFLLITKARDRALEWIEMSEGRTHNMVIACDRWKEARLNLNAIRLMIGAIRTGERVGTTSMMEKAFAGYAAITEGASVSSAA